MADAPSRSQFAIVENGTLEEFQVEGTTYAPTGNVLSNGKVVDANTFSRPAFTRLAQIASLCNDAKISYSDDNGSYACVGEPTEGALRTLAEKIGSTDAANQLATLAPAARVGAVNSEIEQRFSRLLTFEFSRDRKSMSVLVRENDAATAALYVKGAPESVLDRCEFIQTASGREPLTAALRADLDRAILAYGSRGLRALALAYVDDVDSDAAHYKVDSPAKYVGFEQRMVFAGLVGMLDPPRPEVRGAIAKCKTAGVRVIVITGDNKRTAETICRDIGVFGKHEDLEGKSFTGREFDALDEQGKVRAVLNASLFSRTEPGHKLKIVELLQSQGLVCAMSGDGVNDASAIRRADIGIAMGSGTDIAKLSSDLVLADDNFATIEMAIEEGRAIYENTKQFIRYLISRCVESLPSSSSPSLARPRSLLLRLVERARPRLTPPLSLRQQHRRGRLVSLLQDRLVVDEARPHEILTLPSLPQHLPHRPPRHARGALVDPAPVDEPHYGRSARYRARLQPARPPDHAPPAPVVQGAPHQRVALRPVPHHRHLRRRCDRLWLCVLFPSLETRDRVPASSRTTPAPSRPPDRLS